MSNFVSEMRTKRPAVVQKWVDSLPTIDNSELSQNDQSAATEDICSRTQSLDSEKSNAKHTSVAIVEKFQELNITVDGNTHSAGEAEVFTNTKSIIDETAVDNSSSATGDNSFWQKSPSILAAFQLRTDASQHSETEDLSASTPVQHSCHESEAASSILNKSKLNEFYNKLNISKKRFNFIKERKMEAKRILNNAKSRFLQSADNGGPDTMSKPDDVSSDNIVGDSNEDDENVAVANAPDAVTTASGTASIVCDAIEMDISTDEYSRLSQSNDFLSVDDDDSFNISMPSINDGQIGPSSHLSVNRKVAMGEIGRSTSDNPRLRNKFYLADIGRSFSEHQDDEAIIIGERNISAPSSSIAIQNNNRSNGNYFERRAYSVSPTQRSLKRGTLSRDQSLSDHSSRHRNQLSKGNSFQSDSSHCSSVESLLDARKPDPEAILRHLGFGPAHQEDLLSRIPKRLVSWLFMRRKI